MKILLVILGGLLALLLLGAVVGYLVMKRYLAKSREGVQGTMSDIAEEIESYQEKTQ